MFILVCYLEQKLVLLWECPRQLAVQQAKRCMHQEIHQVKHNHLLSLCARPPSAQLVQTNAFSKEKDDILFPHNSKYLIDHVLYLPVHKRVSFWYLEHMCNAVEKVMKNRVGVKITDTKNVLFQSKL